MGISFNPDTFVPRRDKQFYDHKDTQENTANDIYGSSIQPINRKFSYLFTASGTYTLTQDVILTQVVLNVEGSETVAPNRDVTVTAEINGSSFANCSFHIEPPATSVNGIVIPIPNWRILKNETIGSTFTINAGTYGARVIFIGLIA